MSDKGEHVKENVCTNTVPNALEKICRPFPSQKGMCHVFLSLSVTVAWPGKRKQPASGFVTSIFKDMKWMYNEC